MTSITTIDALERRIKAIFLHCGMSEVQANSVARVIAAGERDGCKSHGIFRVEGVLRTLKAGKVQGNAVPKLLETSGAIVRVDGQSGFSNPAFDLGMPKLVEAARKFGLAALVVNDCTHFAALWPEVEAITAQGLAALVMCPSYATVAPWGGSKPLLGTNPLAFGWPREGDTDFVFDFATSVVARGEIDLHSREGKPLPDGWAIDAEGEPTTVAEAALAGAMLPFGGHKGSALSMMIELLAGVMIGDLTSAESLDYLGTTGLSPRHGELIIALSPEKFAAGRPGNPLARAEVLFDAVAEQGARLPSQRRFAARARSLSGGIALTSAHEEQLDRLLTLGLDAVR
ncbi:Ldh family oxidoreductase [Devosia neptuniae]|uniref:Ldh family oxidoreductase n=1 Tax=Devosia neptuniae TaxID=191302 RepID=UPI0022AE8961|nr:Ldh family oxidoreductase [Devosia neptuniae]MCZ4345514.1 Ldh family oxidoreductase [Devosia neptuniae]